MTLIPTRPLRPLTADELAALRRSGGQLVLGDGWTHLIGPRPHQPGPTTGMVVL